MPAFMWLSVIFRRKYQLSTVFSAVDNFGSSSFKESRSKNAEAFLNLPGHPDQQEASADNSFHQYKSLCNIPHISTYSFL